jgi:sigma-B regulation protein RsbU (phosphoserine phosphatase)
MHESELELARRVHYAFLPEAYHDECLDVAVTSEPLLGLGGDYCGIVQLPEGRVALTMSDATGHGLASALFASRINTYVLSRLTRTVEPCRLIQRLNRFLFERMRGAGMHATFCVAVIDPRAGRWDFAGAGHPPAIHYRAATRDTVLVASQTTLVGVFETLPLPCETTTSALADGDRILLTTDGLLDARTEGGEPFGLDRLRAVVVEHAERTGAELNDALFAAARTYGGGALGDDALLMTAALRRASEA